MQACNAERAHTAESTETPQQSPADSSDTYMAQEPHAEASNLPPVWVRMPVWQGSLTQQVSHDQAASRNHASTDMDDDPTASEGTVYPHQAPAFSGSTYGPATHPAHDRILGYQRMRARVLKVFSGHLDLALLQIVPGSSQPLLSAAGIPPHQDGFLQKQLQGDLQTGSHRHLLVPLQLAQEAPLLGSQVRHEMHCLALYAPFM